MLDIIEALAGILGLPGVFCWLFWTIFAVEKRRQALPRTLARLHWTRIERFFRPWAPIYLATYIISLAFSPSDGVQWYDFVYLLMLPFLWRVIHKELDQMKKLDDEDDVEGWWKKIKKKVSKLVSMPALKPATNNI